MTDISNDYVVITLTTKGAATRYINRITELRTVKDNAIIPFGLPIMLSFNKTENGHVLKLVLKLKDTKETIIGEKIEAVGDIFKKTVEYKVISGEINHFFEIYFDTQLQVIKRGDNLISKNVIDLANCKFTEVLNNGDGIILNELRKQLIDVKITVEKDTKTGILFHKITVYCGDPKDEYFL
jgi:hypothetical protein